MGRSRSIRAAALAAAVALAPSLTVSRSQEPTAAERAKLPAPAATRVDFRRDIEPIFRRSCLNCHGAAMQMGGLRLDAREPALRGGGGAPVIVPGDSAASRLVHLVAGIEKLRMPMSGAPLTSDEVGLVRAWIDQGASWPEIPAGAAAPVAPARSGHWAFTAPVRPSVPDVSRRAWVRNPVDAFVLARLEREGIAPSPEADRTTLIRRASLDLVGLPPSIEEVDRFLADNRPDAYERLVDRLLDSPHFGERWAMPWLDVVHYADSDGFNDAIRPHAWRYRQWVIDALNRDVPFDEFTIEQLAGDLLPEATLESRVATGFLRNTMTNRETGTDSEEFRVEAVIDRTATVGTVWLGLTVGCARCHNHKYDPISHKEFYQLSAFFNSDDEVNIEAPLGGEMGPYLQKLPEYRRKRGELLAQYPVAALQPEWERKVLDAGVNPQAELVWVLAWKRLTWLADTGLQDVVRLPPGRRTLEQADELTDHFVRHYSAVVSPERYKELKFGDLSTKLGELAEQYPRLSHAQAVARRATARRTAVLAGGDFRNPGMPVEPGTPAFLPPLSAAMPAATRLDLARWLVTRDHPLTARVTVNRIWQELFGKGLVETSEDFGTRGERPSHPELLDWLAREFADGGWDRKHMIRLIVTSAVYRQSSADRPDLAARDRANRLLARQTRLRVPAEVVRDVALASSGLLNPAVGGRSALPPLPPGMAELGHFLTWKDMSGADRYRRGVYTLYKRVATYPQLAAFDAPDRTQACSRRDRSITPLQALNLLNDAVFLEAAQGLAARVLRERPGPLAEQVDHAFRLCLARKPSGGETERLLRYYQTQREILDREPESRVKLFAARDLRGIGDADAGAWVGLASVLLNLDEFITRE